MEIIGWGIIIIGGIMLFGGCIWFLVVAFQQETAWGVVCIIPFVGIVAGLIFLVKYWNKARKPFAAQVVGYLVMLLGQFVRDGTL